MPWSQTNPMKERLRLVEQYLTGYYTISELADSYGVSRKTVHKLISRFHADGVVGLSERSRAPGNHPNAFVDQQLTQLLLNTRREHPSWGPRTIRGRLLMQDPELKLPAVSTIGALLKRNGLIESPRRQSKRAVSARARPTIEATAPNVRWDCDYKGDFLLGDQSRCYPLTLTDGYSRMILSIDGLRSTNSAGAYKCLERVFREFGLPGAIRTDNGSPFAPYGGGMGLSRLSVWFIQLGVHHERTRPASPQDNARHERMHRTLKAATARPPEQTLQRQQRSFDSFRRDFNEHRPHQGLADRTPGSLYVPSERLYPSKLAQPEYPGHWEKRKVTSKGIIYFMGERVYVGSAMAGHYIGLTEIDDDLWSAYFFGHELGRLRKDDLTLR